MVGWCRSFEHQVPEGSTISAEWYRKSAEQGNRYGQFYFGECLQFGYGIDRDIDAAIVWYRKSAEQEFQLAIDILESLGN
ncbi:uncharacterized protein BJ171DRAFT_485692 [Polychytrium aggregatum]|uniref:uncharacterized protein n=1 Tax=Polychytrium aggregatum TaxID=110093 RepID=UPI0022FEC4D5|nr:uncharacterized protein BJ171DRAFT_485692 [Polychytrium aggregatum]KAI9209186.1 hypothetical protein BJ171DRAFT_485692 [Polychytrium aggregatum]